MQNFSCTAVFVSAFLITNALGYGQSQSADQQQNATHNYYVTTPQTGVQSAVGSNNQAAGQPAYSVQQVSNSPARQQSHQSTAANYYVAPANYYTNNSQASRQTVSTSARAGHGSQQPTQQTITPPVYVSNASANDKGLLSRLLHRKPAIGQQSSGAVEQVGNLASRAKQSVSYRASKLAGSMQQGVASWYGKDWHGKKTASGERYDMDSMTAAHKTLPFGTVVRVQNERNGRECMVRINNRGPFSKGRVLDLSRAAAHQLDMVGSGVAKIKMEVVGRN